MLRLINEHEVRHACSLDGYWDFVTATETNCDGSLPASYSRKIWVPSAWECLPGLDNYRGKAWLRREFEAGSPGNVRLAFGGVSHTGRVYVDSKFVCEHYDAFTPWDIVIPSLTAGRHEIVVEVDNSFGKHSALHIENDYYTWGGITRPVELQVVDAVFIDKMMITPKKNDAAWSVDIVVCLKNVSRVAMSRKVLCGILGYESNLGEVSIPAGGTITVAGNIEGLNVEEWSANSPKLYLFRALLCDGESILDDKIDRIGFREIRVSGNEILLNGTSFRLRGYNRHEFHPQFGCALPVSAMVADLEILRDLGCNFIRTSHYPNDMRFLDLCDEAGFYIWEESHSRTVEFRHPKFNEQVKRSTREMIEWHHNHPCIIIWASLNECESHTSFGYDVHKRIIRQIRSLDSSRLVTFASNRCQTDICLGLVDIVSWNLYHGWYIWRKETEGPECVESGLIEMLEWLHSENSHGGQGKPVILSEFGAGAIYGNRQRCRSKWSEEYQADLLNEQLRVYLNHPNIVGAAIWQFCDCRITPGWRWEQRPRTMNNKGTLDEYRRPKLAYDVVKKQMEQQARQ